jgi:putative DNA primase/helicase
LCGEGDNGKSTLLSLFKTLLGEYAVLLRIDSLMASKYESANTDADLADLRGARFVMTSETEQNQRLAEAKLKRITQGMGEIKATRKYENPITFSETHKLWIDANHRPIVHGRDNAIWNRLYPLPFDTVISKASQDKNLRKRLLAEAEGILTWAAEGARTWYENESLSTPPEVLRAVADWRNESDQIGRFIEQCCELHPECVKGAVVRARELYTAYQRWAQQVGEKYVASEKSFSEDIGRHLQSSRDEKGKLYLGIALTSDGSCRVF